MLDWFARSVAFQTFGSTFMKGLKKFERLGIGAYFIAVLPFLLISLAFDASYQKAMLPEKMILLLLLLIVMFLLIFDVTAVGCLLENPAKSEYFLATGVTKKEVLKDKGLLGEFNAYVLSQKLKVPHRTLYNVCVPMPNGNYQEVDAIIITDKWLYVIECKNKYGMFSGSFKEETWIQTIGSKQHETRNVYLQNQDHIFAIEYFLKSRGILNEYDLYSYNIMLTNGELIMNMTDNSLPQDFMYGPASYLKKCIEKMEKEPAENRTENMMDTVYMALLPYALNDKQKRDAMQSGRESISKSGKYGKGDYQYYHFADGIPGITTHEVILRKNRLYTQITFPDPQDACLYWMTLTDTAYEEE